jgi:hypothetical protein
VRMTLGFVQKGPPVELNGAADNFSKELAQIANPALAGTRGQPP